VPNTALPASSELIRPYSNFCVKNELTRQLAPHPVWPVRPSAHTPKDAGPQLAPRRRVQLASRSEQRTSSAAKYAPSVEFVDLSALQQHATATTKTTHDPRPIIGEHCRSNVVAHVTLPYVVALRDLNFWPFPYCWPAISACVYELTVTVNGRRAQNCRYFFCALIHIEIMRGPRDLSSRVRVGPLIFSLSGSIPSI
jgi:hypothetical protein